MAGFVASEPTAVYTMLCVRERIASGVVLRPPRTFAPNRSAVTARDVPVRTYRGTFNYRDNVSVPRVGRPKGRGFVTLRGPYDALEIGWDDKVVNRLVVAVPIALIGLILIFALVKGQAAIGFAFAACWIAIIAIMSVGRARRLVVPHGSFHHYLVGSVLWVSGRHGTTPFRVGLSLSADESQRYVRHFMLPAANRSPQVDAPLEFDPFGFDRVAPVDIEVDGYAGDNSSTPTFVRPVGSSEDPTTLPGSLLPVRESMRRAMETGVLTAADRGDRDPNDPWADADDDDWFRESRREVATRYRGGPREPAVATAGGDALRGGASASSGMRSWRPHEPRNWWALEE